MKEFQLLALLLAAIIGYSPPLAHCAKILAIFPFPGPSQYICAQPYLKALAARGHQITAISSFPQPKPLANFTDIPVLNIFEGYDDLIEDVTVLRSSWDDLNLYGGFFNHVTKNVLQNEIVQELLRSNAQFDLVIVEVFAQEALYALAHHFKAQLIGISAFGADPNIDALVGNVSPISFTPHVKAHFNDHMSFRQRLENLWIHTVEYIHFKYVFMPQQIALYRKHVPNAMVNMREHRKTFALLLHNQHFSLSFPRPYVPNAIEIGGMHIHHVPNKLPADMEEFINASPQGAIYFSLGSNIKSKNLSPEKRAILLQTFASLPVNVLWKFEDTELPGKPDNVYISKWFPQPDILAHPKVRLFITHSGLLSTIEAIYHAKPVIGMPVFYDQYLNIIRAKQAGYGLSVNFRGFTKAELRGAIMEMLQNDKYAEKVKLISRRYHDQPMKPLDKAIYWTEYVLRHNGAPHMRVAAQELNFAQLHSLDTMAVLFGGAALLLLLTIWLLARVSRAIFGRVIVAQTKQKQKRH